MKISCCLLKIRCCSFCVSRYSFSQDTGELQQDMDEGRFEEFDNIKFWMIALRKTADDEADEKRRKELLKYQTRERMIHRDFQLSEFSIMLEMVTKEKSERV